jgi:hypothetical protein
MLMREWDPIGVAGWPEAGDEYDNYLGLIAERLRGGAQEQDVVALLRWIRYDRMGLPMHRDADEIDRRVAEVLQQWYAIEMSRWSSRTVTDQETPYGYCPDHGTGVACPIGAGVTAE